MIDLTPLDIRRKKGDFRRALRGYDAELVDDFLDVVADRLEEMLREHSALTERLQRSEERVADYTEREKALTEALVSAQEFRQERISQASREAELQLREARAEADGIRREALREREREEEALRRARARRAQLVEGFKAFLERELRQLAVEAAALIPPEPVGPPAGRVWELHDAAAGEESARPYQPPDEASWEAAPSHADEAPSHADEVPSHADVPPSHEDGPPWSARTRSRWEPPAPAAVAPLEEAAAAPGPQPPVIAESPGPASGTSVWDRYAPAPAVVVAAAREVDERVEAIGTEGLPDRVYGAEAIAPQEDAGDVVAEVPAEAEVEAHPEGEEAPDRLVDSAGDDGPSATPSTAPGDLPRAGASGDAGLPPITGNEPWLPLLEDER